MAGKKGAKRRTRAEVEAVREAAREVLEEHHPMTFRHVHYRLVSRRVVRALLLELRDDPGLSPRVLARMAEL